MKDLEKLTVEELVRLISPNSDVHKELRRRKVIRTKNITGELGEYYVVQYYNNTPGQSNLFLPRVHVSAYEPSQLDSISNCISRFSGI